MKGNNKSLAAIAAMFCALGLASCSGAPRGPAVPLELSDRATVMDDPAIRTWGDKLNPAFIKEIERAGLVEIEQWRAAGGKGPIPPANFLAISGGGEDGAYGAGILCGWSKAGTRPSFKLVTGISTGALTAPFAFLGSAYDEKLRTVYTHVTTDAICKSRGMLAVLFDDAIMSTKPLHKLLATLVDEQMMTDIAAEYAKGRILLVATTNLDLSRSVIWNIGAIAASGKKGSLELIQDTLIASASIPVAFPPVMIDVVADGKPYQEMHVDGGTMSQVFLYPPSFSLKRVSAEMGMTRQRTAYVIRNSRLDPLWATVERKALPIAGRAIDTLIHSQGVADLYWIFATTQRDGVAFQLAYIPETFTATSDSFFDPVYMSKLFDLGFNAATQQGGYPWSNVPPGYLQVEATLKGMMDAQQNQKK